MEYTIQNSALRLTASTAGGLMTALSTADGRQILWDGQPEIWSGRAPLCFPWCGIVEEKWFLDDRGERCEAPTRHGFVRDSELSLTHQAPDCLAFTLDYPGKAGVWPWPFRFTSEHRLEGDTALHTCTAENLSDRPMPVQMGYHPGFVCPFELDTALEEYRVQFESGLVVPLERHLFDVDSIPYENVGNWARLELTGSGKYIQVAAADTFRVLLWSKPGIPGFVCIEPWYGYPDGEHDLSKRMGAEVIQPGEKRSWTMAVTVKV